MDVTNAISKVRFASARPQRVLLTRSKGFAVELICMEPGQELKAVRGPCVYYVVIGTATLAAGDNERDVPTGQMGIAEADETHSLSNRQEHRLVCVAVGGKT